LRDLKNFNRSSKTLCGYAIQFPPLGSQLFNDGDALIRRHLRPELGLCARIVLE
jgi:hypothetical protein